MASDDSTLRVQQLLIGSWCQELFPAKRIVIFQIMSFLHTYTHGFGIGLSEKLNTSKLWVWKILRYVWPSVWFQFPMFLMLWERFGDKHVNQNGASLQKKGSSVRSTFFHGRPQDCDPLPWSTTLARHLGRSMILVLVGPLKWRNDEYLAITGSCSSWVSILLVI